MRSVPDLKKTRRKKHQTKEIFPVLSNTCKLFVVQLPRVRQHFSLKRWLFNGMTEAFVQAIPVAMNLFLDGILQARSW